ncbi:MAG: hypothetical protein ABIB97_03465 [Patescibacteria group bacterium]
MTTYKQKQASQECYKLIKVGHLGVPPDYVEFQLWLIDKRDRECHTLAEAAGKARIPRKGEWKKREDYREDKDELVGDKLNFWGVIKFKYRRFLREIRY